MNKKNRIEKGFRLVFFLSIPHSITLNDSREFFSSQKEKIKTTMTKTAVSRKPEINKTITLIIKMLQQSFTSKVKIFL